MSGSPLFATQNDLPAPPREWIIILLNQQLADALDLHSQVKQPQWNINGLQFFQRHDLFERLTEGVEDHVDSIAA